MWQWLPAELGVLWVQMPLTGRLSLHRRPRLQEQKEAGYYPSSLWGSWPPSPISVHAARLPGVHFLSRFLWMHVCLQALGWEPSPLWPPLSPRELTAIPLWYTHTVPCTFILVSFTQPFFLSFVHMFFLSLCWTISSLKAGTTVSLFIPKVQWRSRH